MAPTRLSWKSNREPRCSSYAMPWCSRFIAWWPTLRRFIENIVNDSLSLVALDFFSTTRNQTWHNSFFFADFGERIQICEIFVQCFILLLQEAAMYSGIANDRWNLKRERKEKVGTKSYLLVVLFFFCFSDQSTFVFVKNFRPSEAENVHGIMAGREGSDSPEVIGTVVKKSTPSTTSTSNGNSNGILPSSASSSSPGRAGPSSPAKVSNNQPQYPPQYQMADGNGEQLRNLVANSAMSGDMLMNMMAQAGIAMQPNMAQCTFSSFKGTWVIFFPWISIGDGNVCAFLEIFLVFYRSCLYTADDAQCEPDADGNGKLFGQLSQSYGTNPGISIDFDVPRCVKMDYLTKWIGLDRSFHWSMDWSIDWLLDRLLDWPIDWLIDLLIDWLIDLLIDWLALCVFRRFYFIVFASRFSLAETDFFPGGFPDEHAVSTGRESARHDDAIPAAKCQGRQSEPAQHFVCAQPACRCFETGGGRGTDLRSKESKTVLSCSRMDHFVQFVFPFSRCIRAERQKSHFWNNDGICVFKKTFNYFHFLLMYLKTFF